MHNLAIALHLKGYEVSGSDDEIFEPSRSRLQKHGLLPDQLGWFPEKLGDQVDSVILGMHARADNPELLKAQELGLQIYSYPEYLFNQSRNKTRVVIAGSHGKTTITSMILHVLGDLGIETDFLVGAQLEGFDVMVRLSETAKWMVMEGDEYLTSPIDRVPKFLHYHPHIAVISGIGWDHVNVFPSFDNYLDQFRMFIESIDATGNLIYCAEDKHVAQLAEAFSGKKIPYFQHSWQTDCDQNYLLYAGERFDIQIFGNHNMTNLNAARNVCALMGVDDLSFYKSISTFRGASLRLEKIASENEISVYRDFAHAPSKLKASVEALRSKYSKEQLLVCFELHTFSSLSASFMHHYAGTLATADTAVVFYDPHAVELKRLEKVSQSFIKEAFGMNDLVVVSTQADLKSFLESAIQRPAVVAFMSSGSFGGIQLSKYAQELIKNE